MYAILLFKGLSKTLDEAWNSMKAFIHMWHHSDITKNKTSLQNSRMDKVNTFQGECQDTYGNINAAACDSSLFNSS